MIKIYVHKSNEGFYTVMAIDEDMILYSNVIQEELLDITIKSLVEDFSDTDREVKVYR